MWRKLLLVAILVALIAALLDFSIVARWLLDDYIRRRNAPKPWPRRTADDIAAPLYSCDSPARIPQEYVVELRVGYTLEEHKRAIGEDVDLDIAITSIFEVRDNFEMGPSYTAILNDASLALVRADRHVDLMHCDVEVRLFPEPGPAPDQVSDP